MAEEGRLEMFEREYLERLKATNPELVRSLEASGQLKAHLEQIGARADDLHEEVLASLLHEYPADMESYLDRLGHLRTLEVMAREKVLHLL